jgi:hypothetical protein
MLAGHGYKLYLSDGQLSPYNSDDLPSTGNLIATKDVDGVRARLSHGSPVKLPVEVAVKFGRLEAIA